MRQLRVLLIDDNLQQLFVTKAQLQNQHTNMDVEIARSSTEGLEKLRIKPFDCVIHSVETSAQAQGDQLGSTLRSLRQNTPLIYLSSKPDEEAITNTSARSVWRDPESKFLTQIKTEIDDLLQENDRRQTSEESLTGRSPESELVLARYKTAFDHSDSMMMIISPDGLTLERCTASLESLLKPLHYSDESFQNIPLIMLVEREDRPRVRTFVRDVIARNEKTDIFKFADGHGNYFELKLIGVPVYHRGETIAIIVYASKVE
jgi:CheY-like chemotaxis protein